MGVGATIQQTFKTVSYETNYLFRSAVFASCGVAVWSMGLLIIDNKSFSTDMTDHEDAISRKKLAAIICQMDRHNSSAPKLILNL